MVCEKKFRRTRGAERSPLEALDTRSDSVDSTMNQWTSVADQNEGQYAYEGSYKFLNIFGSARFLNRFVEANSEVPCAAIQHDCRESHKKTWKEEIFRKFNIL